MAIISRKLYKQIEWAFFNYESLKNKVELYNEDTISQAYGSIKDMRNSGHGVGCHSDPTAQLGTRLAEGPGKIAQYRKWVWVVDKVREHYGSIGYDASYAKLIHLYYSYYGGTHVPEICSSIHIDERSFYRIKSDIIYTAALAATQKGLIELF